MKMEDHSNLNDTRILEIIIALLINLIIFSTNNKLMMYTKYLSLFIIVLCFGLFVSKKDYTVKMNKFIGLYVAFVSMILVGCIWYSSSDGAIDYSIYFISGISIVLFRFSKIFYRYLLKVFRTLFWIFIFSMFLEAASPDTFHSLFGFASFGDETMRALTSGGAISGLAFEKAYAAFICNLGLGMIFAEYICHKSYKYIIQSLIVMVALMMTGKRTLFIIPIAVLLIYVILFSKNNKFIKLAGVGLGITIFIIGAYVLVPGASLIINRIVNSEGDVLSGREVFWNYAMEMFRQNPLFGKGFLSFNDYAFYRGFRYYGERWNYQAHNVYIQLLAETGIVGFLLMTLLIILMLFKIISVVKEKPVFWNILLIYWIILFGVYSFTGNTLYYPCQLIVLIIIILLVSNIKVADSSYMVSKRTIKWKI